MFRKQDVRYPYLGAVGPLQTAPIPDGAPVRLVCVEQTHNFGGAVTRPNPKVSGNTFVQSTGRCTSGVIGSTP
jgi:hypothetical protein